MKILTLVWSVGPGGTERAAVNYAIGYKKYGCQSKVLVLGEGDERLSDLEAAEVDSALLIRNKGNEKKILDEIKKWEANIIHIHNFSAALLEYINQLKTEQTKIVETNVFSRPLYSSIYKAVDLSLQLTSWGYWRYTRRMKAAPYRPSAAVVPYIVDEQKFTKPSPAAIQSFRRQFDIPADAFVAGRIGQAHPSKWDSGLIDVINKTISPENKIYYLLVGLPHNLQLLADQQNDLFRSRVKLIDRIEGDSDLSLYYHSLDCFVHWSAIGESFGYVLTEAMLCGVPVITMLTPFNDNGQYEVVGQNKGGVCVINKSDFVKAVLAFYSDASLVRNIKKELGNRWVEKRFSFEAVMPGLLSIFSQLTGNSKPPTNYSAEAIESFFSFYNRKNPFKAIFVKLMNTAFFFRFTKLAKGK